MEQAFQELSQSACMLKRQFKTRVVKRSMKRSLPFMQQSQINLLFYDMLDAQRENIFILIQPYEQNAIGITIDIKENYLWGSVKQQNRFTNNINEVFLSGKFVLRVLPNTRLSMFQLLVGDILQDFQSFRDKLILIINQFLTQLLQIRKAFMVNQLLPIKEKIYWKIIRILESRQFNRINSRNQQKAFTIIVAYTDRNGELAEQFNTYPVWFDCKGGILKVKTAISQDSKAFQFDPSDAQFFKELCNSVNCTINIGKMKIVQQNRQILWEYVVNYKILKVDYQLINFMIKEARKFYCNFQPFIAQRKLPDQDFLVKEYASIILPDTGQPKIRDIVVHQCTEKVFVKSQSNFKILNDQIFKGEEIGQQLSYFTDIDHLKFSYEQFLIESKLTTCVNFEQYQLGCEDLIQKVLSILQRIADRKSLQLKELENWKNNIYMEQNILKLQLCGKVNLLQNLFQGSFDDQITNTLNKVTPLIFQQELVTQEIGTLFQYSFQDQISGAPLSKCIYNEQVVKVDLSFCKQFLKKIKMQQRKKRKIWLIKALSRFACIIEEGKSLTFSKIFIDQLLISKGVIQILFLMKDSNLNPLQYTTLIDSNIYTIVLHILKIVKKAYTYQEHEVNELYTEQHDQNQDINKRIQNSSVLNKYFDQQQNDNQAADKQIKLSQAFNASSTHVIDLMLKFLQALDNEQIQPTTKILAQNFSIINQSENSQLIFQQFEKQPSFYFRESLEGKWDPIYWICQILASDIQNLKLKGNPNSEQQNEKAAEGTSIIRLEPFDSMQFQIDNHQMKRWIQIDKESAVFLSDQDWLYSKCYKRFRQTRSSKLYPQKYFICFDDYDYSLYGWVQRFSNGNFDSTGVKANIMFQIAIRVKKIHDQGLWIQNFTPQSILVVQSSKVKLIPAFPCLVNNPFEKLQEIETITNENYVLQNQKSNILILGYILYLIIFEKDPYKKFKYYDYSLKILTDQELLEDIKSKARPIIPKKIEAKYRELKETIQLCFHTEWNKRPSIEEIIEVIGSLI